MPSIIQCNTGVTATQHGFILQTLAKPESGIGILQIILEFVGEQFEPNLFFDTLQQVVACHDPLRKTFARHQSIFQESVAAKAIVETTILDWHNKATSEEEVARADFLTADRQRGFNLSEAPLMRCACLHLSGERSLIVFTHHHLILDGIARDAILAELISLYNQAKYEHPLTLQRVSNNALCELDVPANSETKAYWQTTLAGLSKESPLATLRTTTAGQPDPSRQRHAQVNLSPEITRALRAAATKMGCPLSTLIYTAWSICLNRISQNEDIAFLTVRNARAKGREAAGKIGSFVNSVPLRLHIDRDTSLASLAVAVDSAWKSSLPHALAPLSEIKNWSNLNGRTWDNNILFHHDRFEEVLTRSAPVGARRSVRILEHSDLPLTVAVLRRRSLAIHMQYWADAFRPDVIEQVATSFATILTSIAENPECRISDLPYLSEAQRLHLNNAASGPVDISRAALLLHGDFERFASYNPEQLAIEWEEGSLTYGALNQAANALANQLQTAGLMPEEPVAVLIERSAAHLVALFAVLKAGGAYLPLDPAHPDQFLKKIVASAGALRCLASPALAKRAGEFVAGVLPITAAQLEIRAPKAPETTILPEHLAYLIATSGTTGEPKIVEVEHRAAANTLRHSIDKLYAPGDLAVVPWIDSPAADAGVHQIFASLAQGGTLIPIDALENLKFSFRFNNFTAFGSTPSILETLIAGNGLAPQLRAVIFGGEAYPEALPQRLATSSKIRRAVNVYGPTEAAIYCVADDIMATAIKPLKGNVIGRPITNTRIELLDGNLQPTIPGAQGEICISGVNLARGYRNNSDKTQSSFPEATGVDGKRRRIYRSGDVGVVLPDGRLEFHGRIDRQVKISGVRIELDAIERVIESFPNVHRALVAIRTDLHEKKQLLAWVVAQEGSALDTSTLLNFSRKHLLPAMVPRFVMILGEIPMNSSGKPDFAALPNPPNEELGSKTFVAIDERETLIAAEWHKLLNHQSFGRDDDFFEVGGDSFSGMELMLRLGELLGCGLSNTSLNGQWTIAAMADASRTAPPIDSFKLVGATLQGPPVFWFMTNFVNFDTFDDLDVLQPMYLIGTDKIETDKETFETFAQRVAGRIRSIQPTGPYLLGGYCFGGYAAFQIATLLTASGAHVEKLGIVDRLGPSLSHQILTRAQNFRIRYLPLSWSEMVPWRRLKRKPSLHNTAIYGPATEWREQLCREFRPTKAVNSSTLIVQTSHGHRPLSGFIPYCGWRKWISGRLQIERRPHVAPEVGIQQALMHLAGKPTYDERIQPLTATGDAQ